MGAQLKLTVLQNKDIVQLRKIQYILQGVDNKLINNIHKYIIGKP